MTDQLLIQQVLNKTGLTQAQLSRALKITAGAITRWVQGSKGIADKHKLSLYKLCIKKDVDNVDLLFRTVQSDYIDLYEEIQTKDIEVKTLRTKLNKLKTEIKLLKGVKND